MDEYLKYKIDSLKGLTNRFLEDGEWKDNDYFYAYTQGLISAYNWVSPEDQIRPLDIDSRQYMEEKNEA